MSHSPARTFPWLLLLDFALIVVFATIGRAAHDESLDGSGILTTAWPFLAGVLVGHLASRAWRRPSALWPTGVIVWACSLVIGMVLRIVCDMGTDPAFIVVATITLAVFLLGWRGVALLASTLLRRSRAQR